MASKQVLGHINCPCCGLDKGVRITMDKNGHPFGYCDAGCNLQIRIGGDRYRVQKFLERYPWAAGEPEKAEQKPVTVTAPESEPKAKKEPVTVTKTEKKPEPAKKRTGLDDALQFLGVK